MNDYELLGKAVQVCQGRIEKAGMHVEYSLGPAAWLDMMKSVTAEAQKDDWHIPYVSSSFSSGLLNRANAFSIVCKQPDQTKPSGRPRAGVVLRRYDNEDIRHVVLSGKLWLDLPEMIGTDDVVYDWPMSGGFEKLWGTCAQRGGLYVAPPWEGKGIGTSLSLMGLFLTFQWWDVAHCIGLKKGKSASRTSARTSPEPICRARIGTPTMQFRLCHSDRGDALDMARAILESGESGRSNAQRLNLRTDTNVVNLPTRRK